jgi:hypothetical protein
MKRVSVRDRYYDGAGRSLRRRHRELTREWRHRTFGRRTSLYFWPVFVLATLLVLDFTPTSWRFAEGALVGLIAAAYVALPDLLMPDHIARLERGAWGEENTQKALKPLRRQGWLIRHDLATGYGKGNRDHIAVGPAVYLLDSKLLKDEVWLDDKGLHVRRLDSSGDHYVIQDLSERMNRAAASLKRDLDRSVGFPVAVYPVVVLWAHFSAGERWDGTVAYVDGDKIADWLLRRPADLHDEHKREAVRAWLQALPRA